MRKLAGIFAFIGVLGAAISSCSTSSTCFGRIVDGECMPECIGAACADGGVEGGSSACASNADCESGLGCVAGTCLRVCRTHFDCATIGQCAPAVDASGTPGTFCLVSTMPEPAGQFYTQCPYGTECDTARGFTCIGSGVGDLDAYCTRDCASDSDCASGFYCGEVRRSPCDTACGITGNNLDPTCVPADQIGDGKPYQCGPFGATRKLCREREFCTSCDTDLDCLAVPNGICAADASGQKICTQLCDPKHPSCPWGTASTCSTWGDNPAPTCAHKFGSCRGTGQGCEPCVRDEDCGSNGICTASTFTGEHWCIDLSTTCSCDGLVVQNHLCSGGGCPKSPGGLEMICIADPMSSIDGKCYGANTAQNLLISSQQTGCWPAR